MARTRDQSEFFCEQARKLRELAGKYRTPISQKLFDMADELEALAKEAAVTDR